MATTKPQLLTADDLLRLYSEGVHGELILGVLCETLPAGGRHGEIALMLGAEILSFVRIRRLGRVATNDPGVWLTRGTRHCPGARRSLFLRPNVALG